MPSSRIIVTTNRISEVRAQLRGEFARRIGTAAEAMRDDLRESFEGGDLPLQPDTTALAQSLAVQGTTGTGIEGDFSERVDAAREAYTSGDSRWEQPVRDTVTRMAYTEEHFEARVASSPEEISDDDGVIRAAVYTMLAYGIFWEFGHNNVYTGRYVERAWMLPFVLNWWATHAEEHFAGMV